MSICTLILLNGHPFLEYNIHLHPVRQFQHLYMQIARTHKCHDGYIHHYKIEFDLIPCTSHLKWVEIPITWSTWYEERKMWSWTQMVSNQIPALKWQKYPSRDPHVREIWTESIKIDRGGANWPFRKVMVQNDILSQNQGKWQLNHRYMICTYSF